SPRGLGAEADLRHHARGRGAVLPDTSRRARPARGTRDHSRPPDPAERRGRHRPRRHHGLPEAGMSTLPSRLAAHPLGLGLATTVTSAQSPRSAGARPDSVTIPASTKYERSALFRWLFGDGYRDLWATPIRVAVLDLDTFDGGLVPEELGGGNATLSLHLDA